MADMINKHSSRVSPEPEGEILSPLPFFGLGFGMQGAIAWAECLTVRTVRPRPAVGIGHHPNPTAAPAGYDLLVRLGREIRGR